MVTVAGFSVLVSVVLTFRFVLRVAVTNVFCFGDFSSSEKDY